MIIMTQMKLLHPLNSKANRIQFYISILLIAIGIIAIFIQYDYEINYSNKYIEGDFSNYYYKKYHPDFNIINGLWAIPLLLGIILFCTIFAPMDLSNKNIKYQIKKYYKYKKRELKKY